MKSNESQEKGKSDLAKEALKSALFNLNFPLEAVSKFISNIRQEENNTMAVLEKIEHGIDKWGSKSARMGGFKPTGKSLHGMEIWDYVEGDYTKFNQRMAVASIQTDLSFLGSICMLISHQNDSLVNSALLTDSIVTDEKHKESREVVQLCIIQLLAMDKEISEQDFKEYRGIVKYLRNRLEVSRMQLHLTGQPTYPTDVMRVDLFIKILEERVKVWDAPAPVKKIRKTKKA
jgi:hypothetical protein